MASRLVFFFGRNPGLSFAEALFFFQDWGEKFSVSEKAEKFAVFAFEKTIDAQQAMNALGGTAKIATVLFELENLEENELEKKLGETGFFGSLEKKFFYFSQALSKNAEDNNALRNALVSGFKKLRVRAMFKKPKPFKKRAQETMGPSEIMRWKLLDEGFELIVLECNGRLLVCKTIAATETKELEKRDLSRPEQSPKQAVSIRLARILLNLSGAQKGKTVLDAFCGIGTIMQEALLNGANAIGLELNPKTAAQAEKNLEWFSREYKIKVVWRIINTDASLLSKVLKKGEFDCVATEPYMGPLINTVLPEQIVKKRIAELEQLYSAVFAELSRLMVAKQRIAFILPSIPATSGKMIAASEKVFLEHGFKAVHPSGATSEEAIFPYNYKQENSKILRRIFVLEKAV